jgi:predicted HicB family RNase H-like nuclease
MSTMLEYKGYLGSVEYNDEDEVFHGRLEFIRDLVTYEGADAKGLKEAFHEAVDDYLALCTERGTQARRAAQGQLQRPPGP